MRIHTGKLLGLTAAAAIFSATPLMAQGKGHGKGNKGHGEHGRVVVIDNGSVIYRGDGRRIPPGLAKKPGQMPPGQYRKLYSTYQGAGVLRDILVRHGYTVVRTTPYRERQYVYYRTPDGVLRRAIVSPGTTRLSFNNVPSLIVQEVVARLY
jgi:hypothetical protein